MPDNTEQTFRQFCENSLSLQKFKKLYELPNTTKYSITNALKNPQRMSFNLLQNISEMIGIPALVLAKQYECSLDTMTAREYISLLEENSPK